MNAFSELREPGFSDNRCPKLGLIQTHAYDSHFVCVGCMPTPTQEGLKVAPTFGSAVVWPNVDHFGNPEPLSRRPEQRPVFNISIWKSGPRLWSFELLQGTPTLTSRDSGIRSPDLQMQRFVFMRLVSSEAADQQSCTQTGAETSKSYEFDQGLRQKNNDSSRA